MAKAIYTLIIEGLEELGVTLSNDPAEAKEMAIGFRKKYKANKDNIEDVCLAIKSEKEAYDEAVAEAKLEEEKALEKEIDEAEAEAEEDIEELPMVAKRAILNAIKYNEKNSEKKEFETATIDDVAAVLKRTDSVGKMARDLAKNMVATLGTLSGQCRSTPTMKAEDYDEFAVTVTVGEDATQRIIGVSKVENASGTLFGYVKNDGNISCSFRWGKEYNTGEYYDFPIIVWKGKTITHQKGRLDVRTGEYAVSRAEMIWNALIECVAAKLKEMGKIPEKAAQ